MDLESPSIVLCSNDFNNDLDGIFSSTVDVVDSVNSSGTGCDESSQGINDMEQTMFQGRDGQKSQKLEIFACDICNKPFNEAWALKTHYHTHSNFRGFTCDWPGCSFAFKTKGSLVRHMRRHTDERPFKCSKCNRAFRESGALRRHLRSRTSCELQSDKDYPNYGKTLPLKKSVIMAASRLSFKSDDVEESSDIKLEYLNDTDFNTVLEETVFSSLDTSSSADTPENFSEFFANFASDGLTSKLSTKEPLADNRLTCLACCVKCENSEKLFDHLRAHLLPAGYHCPLCKYLAATKQALMLHMEITGHTPMELDQEFPTLEEYISSLPDVLSPNFYQECDNEEDKVRSASLAVNQLLDEQSLRSGLETQSGGDRLLVQCPACERFYTPEYLRRHLRSHIGTRPFGCDECGKTFGSNDTLTKHKVVHMEERVYTCGVCPKQFKRLSHVKEHLKVHSDERSFTCKVCGKAFKTANACKVHMRTHSGEFPYYCDVCGKFFREKAPLVRHARTHTGERPFECKSCGKRFAEHGSLNRHMRAKVPCSVRSTLQSQGLLVSTSPADSTAANPSYHERGPAETLFSNDHDTPPILQSGSQDSV